MNKNIFFDKIIFYIYVLATRMILRICNSGNYTLTITIYNNRIKL